MSKFDITKIDKNFLGEEIKYDGLTFYHVSKEPFKLYGLYRPTDGGPFKRMPTEIAEKINPSVAALHKHTSGGRIRFRTDSKQILVRSILQPFDNFDHMPKTGFACFDLYVDGEYKNSFRHSSKKTYGNTYDSTITVGEKKMREILINFPLYNAVDDVFIALDDDATIEAPTPYTYEKPFVVYGSSITQGGCASHPGNAFPNQLSRRFDMDFINLGFSSGGLAEVAMAEYIASLDMSMFLFDYDHNALTAEYLEETHERMFKIVREKHPNIPIIMASAADYFFDIDERRAVIKKTYDNAVAAGDKNVYYIDGQTIYAPVGRSLCTVDHIHPNDIGFLMMANAYGKVIENILNEQKGN